MKLRALLAFTTCMSAVAAAQTPDEIAHCTATASDTERLACYDALFSRREAATQPSPATTSPAKTDDAAASTGAATSSVSAASAGAAAPSESVAAGAAAPSESVAAGTGAAAGGVAAQASSSESDFGFDGRPPPDQKFESAKGPDEMRARVAKVQVQPRGEYILTLDNGQVWVQQEANWQVGFKVGDEVVIKRGTFRSYRLRLAGNNRATLVTRIE